MPITNLPMDAGGVQIIPSMPSQVPVSAELQQTLALMLAIYHGQRIPVKGCHNGVQRVNDDTVYDIIHITAPAPAFVVTGTRLAVTSVLLRAHPDNVGRIWVRTKGTASATNAWPLDAGEGINLSMDCYSQASALIEENADTLIVAFIG